MKYIFANWKQHFSYSETIQKFNMFLQGLQDLRMDKSMVVGIAVSHESLDKVSSLNSSSLLIGSQSCSSFYQGSYTGEISARSLKETGSEFVFVGHSERRKFLKETEKDIGLQLNNGLKSGLKVVLCIGESLKDKESRQSLHVLRSQIISALDKVECKKNIKNILIAYEPQYAIGTGILPKLADIEQTMVGLQNIKNEASLNLQDTPLLYGGSINEKNYKSVMELPYVQGLLIGGASLQIDTFKKIVSGCKLINKKYVSSINKNYNAVENI